MKQARNFTNYFNHLMEYQNQLLPDNTLSRDYAILYDYLMDLLERDNIVGEFLVRKQQHSRYNEFLTFYYILCLVRR